MKYILSFFTFIIGILFGKKVDEKITNEKAKNEQLKDEIKIKDFEQKIDKEPIEKLREEIETEVKQKIDNQSNQSNENTYKIVL